MEHCTFKSHYVLTAAVQNVWVKAYFPIEEHNQTDIIFIPLTAKPPFPRDVNAAVWME